MIFAQARKRQEKFVGPTADAYRVWQGNQKTANLSKCVFSSNGVQTTLHLQRGSSYRHKNFRVLWISSMFFSIVSKGLPIIRREHTEGSRFWLLTSALDGGRWSKLRSGRFTRGKQPPVSIVQVAGWVSETFWKGVKEIKLSCPLPGFEPPSVQHVASRFTDCTISTPSCSRSLGFFVQKWSDHM
jgi:hypothetical protein